MRVADIALGLRVRRNGGGSSLVQDRPGDPRLHGRRVGIVISEPDRQGTGGTYTVRIQWEGTALTETVHVHRLEPLPLADQPVTLGGQRQAAPGTFVAKPPSTLSSC